MSIQSQNFTLESSNPHHAQEAFDDDSGNHVIGILVLGVLTGMVFAAAMLLMGHGLLSSFLGYVGSTQASILFFAAVHARTRPLES